MVRFLVQSLEAFSVQSWLAEFHVCSFLVQKELKTQLRRTINDPEREEDYKSKEQQKSTFSLRKKNREGQGGGRGPSGPGSFGASLVPGHFTPACPLNHSLLPKTVKRFRPGAANDHVIDKLDPAQICCRFDSFCECPVLSARLRISARMIVYQRNSHCSAKQRPL